MKKQVPSLLICLVLLLILFPAFTAADTSGTCGNNLNWSFNSSTGALTITGSGAMTDFASYNNQPWASIRAQITSIYIYGGTTIGNYAFRSVKATDVYISNSVTSIGDYAFMYCSFESITLPNQLKKIGVCAFSNCTNLTSIKIPKSVESIDRLAFSTNLKLKTAAILNKNVTLGSSGTIFNDCSRLATLSLAGTESQWASRFDSLGVDKTKTTVYYNSIRGKCGTSLFWSLDDDTGTLTITGSGAMTNYADYTSTPWYAEKNTIKKVSLPGGLTNIGDYAFCYCNNLSSMSIPSSVTSIGKSAFSGCSQIASVSLQDGLASIGTLAFSSCSKLTSISIPESVSNIGNYAFSSCTGLTNLVIPCSVDFGTGSFDGCNAITSVHLTKGTGIMPDNKYASSFPWYASRTNAITITLDEGITNIGKYAFDECTGLASIVIPNSVTKIGEFAFYGCSGLKTVVIPDSVTTIGSAAFSGCSGLTDLTVPYDVTLSSSTVFYNCSISTLHLTKGRGTIPSGSYTNTPWYNSREKLTTVTLDDGIREIGSKAFYQCTNLTNLTLPCSLTYSSDSFSDCKNIVTIHFTQGNGAWSSSSYSFFPTYISRSALTSVFLDEGITSIGDYAFYYCSKLTELAIPESVTSIGSHAFYLCTGLQDITIGSSVTNIGSFAFYQCTGLRDITIGSSVTSIGDSAFAKCTGLSAFHVSAENTAYCTEDGVLFTKDKSELLMFPFGKNASSYEIPQGVISIGGYAFSDCAGLNSVVIPNSVVNIGQFAFYGCTGLTSLVIPESVTTIGACAFSKCTELTAIVVPASVTDIGNYAFGSCSGLTSVTLNNRVFGYGEFEYCTALTSFVIPNGFTSTGEYTFSNCTGLTSVTIPDSVISIGSTTFLNCSRLVSLTIPGGVTSIGSSAFSGCSGLGSLTISDSVTSIGPYAFNECKGLASIVIPDSVTQIGHNAFYGCSGLTEIVIPDGMTSIAQSTFYGCAKIASVTIPNSVISIGDNAFYLCSKLQDVYYSGSSITRGKIQIGANNSCLSNATWHSNLSATWKNYDGTVLATDIVVPGGTPAFTGAIPPRQFFTFTGWDPMPKAIYEDAVYTAQYEANTSFTITWKDYDGIVLAITQVPAGDTPKYPEQDPSRGIEYRFTGWSPAPEPILSNMTYSAQYRQKSKCGNNTYWEYDSATGTLIISGTGYTNSYMGTDANGMFYPTNQQPWASQKKNIRSVRIEEGITAIGDCAFYQFPSVSSVTLPKGLKIIGWAVFMGCQQLTSIDFPEGIETIKSGAFSGTGLTSVVLPESVTYIGSGAFQDCSKLTSINIPSSINSFSGLEFSGCTSLNNVVLPDGITYFGSKVFYNCSSLTSINIPDNIDSIGDSAFAGCSSLETITLGASVKTIGDSAFKGCIQLQTVYFHGAEATRNKISIEANNSWLTNARWQYISTYSGSMYLTDQTWEFSDGILRINGDGVLMEHNHLPWELWKEQITAVKLSAGFLQIWDVFSDCTNLTSVTLPSTITYIGQGTFSGCTKLSNVYYQGTEAQRSQIGFSSNNDALIKATWHYNVALEPTITTQPSDVTAGLGSTATFRVVATDAESYQWQYMRPNETTWNDVQVDGKSATFNQTNVATRHNGFKFRCKVSNGNGSVLSDLVTLTVAAAPTITSQPSNVMATLGSTATFRVVATNATSYQWQFMRPGESTWNDVQVDGKSATFNQKNVEQRHNGFKFRCKVSNGSGSVLSNEAALTVGYGAPTITSQPSNVSAALGSTATFRVAASNATSYQWQFMRPGESTWNEVQVNGKSATFNQENVENRHNGFKFRCKVSNGIGSVYSSAATLTVSAGPTITSQPSNVSAALGTTATFKVTASNATSYQWQFMRPGENTWNEVQVNGKSATFNQTNVENRHNGFKFRCRVTNASGTVYSNAATLMVAAVPTITSQPSNVSAALGTTATFRVAASNATGYQWEYQRPGESTWNEAQVNGKSATFNQTNVENRHNGFKFRCKVSNANGSVYSNAATLTVTAAPTITSQPSNVSAALGTTATFRVAASNATNYQWQYQRPGESTWYDVQDNGKSATLNQTNVESRHNGFKFRCKVSNVYGSVYSNTATLTTK